MVDQMAEYLAALKAAYLVYWSVVVLVERLVGTMGGQQAERWADCSAVAKAYWRVDPLAVQKVAR